MELLKRQIIKLFKNNRSPRLSQAKPLLIEIKNIGVVGFKRSYKAKRLILKIKEAGEILVSLPRGVTLEEGINFVIKKKLWVNKTIKKLTLKKEKSIEAANIVMLIDRETAKKMILSRVTFLANIHGFKFNKIRIKNQKTLWGSCSAKNNLNFNYKIASLPNKLMDYVILHELVHTNIKNHSSQFWNTLDIYLPGSKSLKKELKNIRFSE